MTTRLKPAPRRICPTIPLGIIEVDSDSGEFLGFTSDRWFEHSHLFRVEDEIWLSAVMVTEMRKGYLKALIERIEALDLVVAIPTPLWTMEAILLHWGWMMREQVMDGETVEVWRRK